MAVGFYLAFDERSGADTGSDAPRVFGQMEPLVLPDDAVDSSVEAVELVHREAASRKLDLMLRQKSWVKGATDDASTLETTFELGLSEDVAEADPAKFDRQRVLAITRHYQKAQAEVSTGGGDFIGTGITSQVEELMRGSITRMYVAPSGEPLDFEWREVPNPQARRMLFLVRDAHTFLTPRFFAGALNPGDTWSYKRPMIVEEPELGVTASGQVDIDNRFAGVVTHEDRRLGVVRQTLEASVEGTLDAEDASATFSLEGSGEGLVLVDLGAGRVHAADIVFERTLTIQPSTVQPSPVQPRTANSATANSATAESGDEPIVQISEISLGLRPADGAALPDFPDKKDEDVPKLEASNEE
jgi:hypothetical protein